MAKPLSIRSLTIALLLGNQVKVSIAGFGWEKSGGLRKSGAVSKSSGGSKNIGSSYRELQPDGNNGWTGADGGNRDTINSYRISGKSDRYRSTFRNGPRYNYAGIVVYDGGSYPGILPGYIIMADSATPNLRKYRKAMEAKKEPTEGMVHGYGVWKRFGESPTTMIRKYGMKFSGFAYLNGKVEFGSTTLNARKHSEGGWHHDVHHMVDDEKVVIAGVVEAWKQYGIAKTYYRNTLTPFICTALDDFSSSIRSTYRVLYNCPEPDEGEQGCNK